MNPYIPLEPSCVYHIYNRGINGVTTFRKEENYTHFLNLYAKYCYSVFETYAYCLLGNHFHLLVRVRENLPTYGMLYKDVNTDFSSEKAKKQVKPSTQLAHLFNAYAQGYNHSFSPKRTGGLFEEPFKRKLVDNDAYFANLVHYIHKNPEKHGLIADFRDYRYSSYHSHLSLSGTRLERKTVLNWFGDSEQYVTQHEESVDENLLAPYLIEFD